MPSIKQFCFNALGTNCFLVWNDSREAVIIDPGTSDREETDALYSFISSNGLKPTAILLTHGHFDHAFGARTISSEWGIPVYMQPDDKPILAETLEYALKIGFDGSSESPVTIDIQDGDVLNLAGIEWKVIGTPGHTPGGVCYHLPEHSLLFSGDSLFHDTIGRTDFPYGDYDKLIVSIMDKLMALDGGTEVLPGHGGPTSIGRERSHNPFLIPFNEKEDLNPDWDLDGIALNGSL